MESLHNSGVCNYNHAPIPFALNCTNNDNLRDFHRRRCVYLNTSDVLELERRSMKAFEDGDLSAHQLYVDQIAVATRVDLSTRTCFKKHGIDSRAALNGTGLSAMAPTATYCTCRLLSRDSGRGREQLHHRGHDPSVRDGPLILLVDR